MVLSLKTGASYIINLYVGNLIEERLSGFVRVSFRILNIIHIAKMNDCRTEGGK